MFICEVLTWKYHGHVLVFVVVKPFNNLLVRLVALQ